MNTTAPAPDTDQLLHRLAEVVAKIEKAGYKEDSKKRVYDSILTPFGFRPMPMFDLAAMYMARQGEVSFDMAWALAAEAKRRHAAMKPKPKSSTKSTGPKVSMMTTPMTVEVDQYQEQMREVLTAYTPAQERGVLRSRLMEALVRPFDWACLIARHPEHGISAVHLISLFDDQRSVFHSTLLPGDADYVRAWFARVDHHELADQRQNHYLFYAIQSLRTVK